MFEGYHYEGDIPILVSVEYDEELNKYVVEVIKGLQRRYRTFTPKHKPKEGVMHISDTEKSVKISNILLKNLQIAKGREK
ncbi:MAG: hypothetical protein R3321_08815 [Nitrososphaeraceae archaeon]|nr:hypothetical protein [Nitrososphaeraceae archaeon]